MIPLHHDPHFTFRFADDRIIPRFHLEGVEAGRRILIFKLDPGTDERLGLLATATVGAGGWVDLNLLTAERITDAHTRVKSAKERLEIAQRDLHAAETAAAAAPDAEKAAAQERVQNAKQAVARDQDIVNFENNQLDHLLHPGGVLAHVNWGIVLQYLVFTILACIVLYYLMKGISSSPPEGTTPRGLITFLIAVVTVAIALILVLATIVSDSPDREKRFSQGKEVLTALIGVLGTIVGFYFGSSVDTPKSLSFDPVVITREGETITLNTSVHGGKAPYSFEITFTPSTIPAEKGETRDGQIKVVRNVPQAVDVSFVISVRDSEGKTSSVDSKKALHRKGANGDGKKK
jgi:hypothetical protein